MQRNASSFEQVAKDSPYSGACLRILLTAGLAAARSVCLSVQSVRLDGSTHCPHPHCGRQIKKRNGSL
jgi:hypothetical protein